MYPVNESTDYSASRHYYHKLKEAEEVIKSKIATGEVAHTDETGLRVTSKLQRLHTASSLLFTYLFVHEKRESLAPYG